VADYAGDFGSFEDLAMPHFVRLYNFACWLTHDSAFMYVSCAARLFLLSAGDQLPRLDVQDFAQYIPDFADRAQGGCHD
jgi:hypothetical protein